MNIGNRLAHLLIRVALALGLCATAGAQQATRAPSAAAQGARYLEAGYEQAPDELMIGGKILGFRVAAQAGDYCLVDHGELHQGDAVYLVDGQRVALHWPQCYRALAAEPQSFLAKLRPRGAFLGASREAAKLSPAWFLFGAYVLVGLIFGALCAHVAVNRGQSPAVWFGAGLFFSAFGYLLLLTRPALPVAAPEGVPRGLRKIALTFSPAACPMCGRENHPSANRCLGCGSALTPRVASELARAGLETR